MIQAEMRQEPFKISNGRGSRPFYLDESIVHVSQTDWLYTALDEIMLGSPPPIWTKNEWIFPPVKFQSSNVTISGVEYPGLDVLPQSANITMNTPAFRSRLECNNIPVPKSGWMDEANNVFRNQSRNPITGYVLPNTLFEGKPYNTSVFSAPRRMACCQNDTDSRSASVIAYWSSNSPIIDARPSEPFDNTTVTEPILWTTNFTIKWILGHARTTILDSAEIKADGSVFPYYGNPNYVSPGDAQDDTLLYFSEQPQMTAMNCKPVIEQANAYITVARYTGQVLDAKILDRPRPNDTAWAHMWNVVHVETEYFPMTTTYYGLGDNQTVQGAAVTHNYKLNVRYASHQKPSIMSNKLITDCITKVRVISSLHNSSARHTYFSPAVPAPAFSTAPSKTCLLSASASATTNSDSTWTICPVRICSLQAMM
jgi:hypothetical protein